MIRYILPIRVIAGSPVRRLDREILERPRKARKAVHLIRHSLVKERIRMGTGSEVQHCLAARDKLAEKGIGVRVVSMPSFELFEAQSQEYRDEVLPPSVTARLAIEAGATACWFRYVGLDGDIIGIDHFGASAPGDIVMEKFGFTSDNVVQRALALLDR